MKRFHFSLEALLKERIREVEKTQKDMVPVVNRFQNIQNQQIKVTGTLSQGLMPGTGISGNYFHQLGTIYTSLQFEKKEAEQELSKWQEILSQKIKERKIIEIIKERRFHQWKKELKKKEAIDQQELVLNYF